jgi:DNA helicase-2/ATP-dependent DNA helicase PcrA
LRNRGIGKQTFFELYDLARIRGMKFSDIVQEVKGSPNLLSRNGNRVSKKVKEIESFLTQIGVPEEEKLDSWINNLATEVIQDECERKEVLGLFSKVRELGEAESLEELLRALNVSLGDVEQEKERGKVSIMTMHQAKGLSADAVILAAAEDEYIPGREKGEAVDDERRLLYVSLTRARKYLYVTFCQRRMGQQSYSGRRPSERRRAFTRFLSGGPYAPENGQSFIRELTFQMEE